MGTERDAETPQRTNHIMGRDLCVCVFVCVYHYTPCGWQATPPTATTPTTSQGWSWQSGKTSLQSPQPRNQIGHECHAPSPPSLRPSGQTHARAVQWGRAADTHSLMPPAHTNACSLTHNSNVTAAPAASRSWVTLWTLYPSAIPQLCPAAVHRCAHRPGPPCHPSGLPAAAAATRFRALQALVSGHGCIQQQFWTAECTHWSEFSGGCRPQCLSTDGA